MANIVKYGGLTIDAMDKVSGRVDSVSGGSFIKIGVGENCFRFLPSKAPGINPLRATALHYIDAVPGLDKMVVFACPRVELKQPCIACQKVQEMNESKNPIDRERAWQMKASVRIYANVIDRNNPDAGVKVLGFGKQIHEQLKAILTSARLGGDFTDPTENGFDIIIVRTGSGKNDTKYVVSADRRNGPLGATVAETNALIDSQQDLEQFVKIEPPEELLMAWQGLANVGRARTSEATQTKRVGPGTRRSAVGDAEQEEIVYDENFNPISKDDQIPY